MAHDPRHRLMHIALPFGYGVRLWHVSPHNPFDKDDDDVCGWIPGVNQCDPVLHSVLKTIVKMEVVSFLTSECNSIRSSESLHILSITVLLPRLVRRVVTICLRYDERRIRSFIVGHLQEAVIRLQEKGRVFVPKDVVHVSSDRPFSFAPDSTKMTEWVDDACREIYREIAGRIRPWYKHPKWHVHHWRLSFYRQKRS